MEDNSALAELYRGIELRIAHKTDGARIRVGRLGAMTVIEYAWDRDSKTNFVLTGVIESIVLERLLKIAISHGRSVISIPVSKVLSESVDIGTKEKGDDFFVLNGNEIGSLFNALPLSA